MSHPTRSPSAARSTASLSSRVRRALSISLVLVLPLLACGPWDGGPEIPDQVTDTSELYIVPLEGEDTYYVVDAMTWRCFLKNEDGAGLPFAEVDCAAVPEASEIYAELNGTTAPWITAAAYDDTYVELPQGAAPTMTPTLTKQFEACYIDVYCLTKTFKSTENAGASMDQIFSSHGLDWDTYQAILTSYSSNSANWTALTIMAKSACP